jgi:hypothetical protein
VFNESKRWPAAQTAAMPRLWENTANPKDPVAKCDMVGAAMRGGRSPA